jgi:recombination protein RecT
MKTRDNPENRAVQTFATKVRYLESRIGNLAKGMPQHMDASRLVRSAVVAMNKNPDLLACSEESVYASLSISANLGLEIVGGQGFLVPYKGICTFVPGWMGLVDLVSRSGRAGVWTDAVYDGDIFEYAKGDKPFITHKPQGEDDPAKITHVYAVGRIKGGDWPVIEVWTMARVAKHLKKYNKVGAKHYAYGNMEMYGRKVALLQVLKYMPKSQEMINAITASEAADEGRGLTIDGDMLVKQAETPPANDQSGSSEETHRHHGDNEKANTTSPGPDQRQGGASANAGSDLMNAIALEMRNASTNDALDEAAEQIRTAVLEHRADLDAIYRECREALEAKPDAKQAARATARQSQMSVD